MGLETGLKLLRAGRPVRTIRFVPPRIEAANRGQPVKSQKAKFERFEGSPIMNANFRMPKILEQIHEEKSEELVIEISDFDEGFSLDIFAACMTRMEQSMDAQIAAVDKSLEMEILRTLDIDGFIGKNEKVLKARADALEKCLQLAGAGYMPAKVLDFAIGIVKDQAKDAAAEMLRDFRSELITQQTKSRARTEEE